MRSQLALLQSRRRGRGWKKIKAKTMNNENYEAQGKNDEGVGMVKRAVKKRRYKEKKKKNMMMSVSKKEGKVL